MMALVSCCLGTFNLDTGYAEVIDLQTLTWHALCLTNLLSMLLCL